MKRQFLKELGLNDDQIEKIMAENGRDVQAEQAKAEVKEMELITAQNTIQQLQNTAKQYEGVNVEELKNQLITAQAKYDADLKQTKMDAAVSLALAGAKAKNLIAAKALLSPFLEKAELDENGSVKGLEEQIKGLREGQETSFLFEKDSPKAPKIKGFEPAQGRDPFGDDPEGGPGTFSEAVRFALASKQQENDPNDQGKA